MATTIYLDHAATTPLHPKALEAMMPFFSERFGNPSTIYSLGQEGRRALDEARGTVADILGCNRKEVIFTSGGTESDNAAIKGVAFALRKEGNHIITSSVEHHAVLETCNYLEKYGFDITYLPVDRYGMVNLEDVRAAINDNTILISIMMANNEVGTIEPIESISHMLKDYSTTYEHSIVLHTDAVQGAGFLNLDINKLGVDILSLSAHKFYGPKGVGILFIKQGTPFIPQQNGGVQEGHRRAGTENLPGIIGAATALKLAVESQNSNIALCRQLRDRLIQGVHQHIPNAQLTGHPDYRLPNNASFCFHYVEGESILLHLDFAGIAAASGSACTSGSLEPSHCLMAMGVPVEVAHGSVRFTCGIENTEEEVDKVISVLTQVVLRLREISPFAQAKVNKR
ncbi:cysteine desulfurase NifS [Chloroflexota bacterium]